VNASDTFKYITTGPGLGGDRFGRRTRTGFESFGDDSAVGVEGLENVGLDDGAGEAWGENAVLSMDGDGEGEDVDSGSCSAGIVHKSC